MGATPERASMRPLAYADAAALLVFTALGLRFHAVPLGIEELLRTAAPLWLAWFGVAWAVGTYRRPGVVGFLLTWFVGVPLGLVVRQLWLGRPLDPGFQTFVSVALAATLVCLLAGRAVALAWRARRSA